MPVVVTHKKSSPQVHDSYELQLINLNTTHKCLKHFKETGCFQRKRNSSNIKKIKCYNYDIREHYTRDCDKLKKSQTLVIIK